MGKSDSLGWTSLTLSIAVATIALLLGLRLWWERRIARRRTPSRRSKAFPPSGLAAWTRHRPDDFLAFGVYVGSRLPIFVVEPVDPASEVRGDGGRGAVQSALETHPNRRFLAVWMGVFASVVLLLGLALIDWISTRRYAERHRRAMNRERLEILRETIRLSHTREDGLGERPTSGVVLITTERSRWPAATPSFTQSQHRRLWS